MDRILHYYEAINEALDLSMANDPNIFIMGLGVPDPKGIFGTTTGLQEKYGNSRVMDMPCSENGMTGIAIGAALTGMKPIMTHQRVDFALLSFEQIINQAAKWSYMFNGTKSVPLVIRLIIGRGWGQGPQHSQSLESVFGHIPGLKVVMPTTPYDVKGMLISAISDPNPVILLEHRWLHGITGVVPDGIYSTPFTPKKVRDGNDITVVSSSYMTLETMRAGEILEKIGVDLEIIDIRSVRPLDDSLILESVDKTGRLLTVDMGWSCYGIGSEIISRVAEKRLTSLRMPPKRLSIPDCPVPTSPGLTRDFYPTSKEIVLCILDIFQIPVNSEMLEMMETEFPHDVPDPLFTGPF